MPIYGKPTFCAASAIGPTGNPTTPNMYSTPCSFRLFASRSAPLISAIDSLLSFELVSDPACRKSERPHITHLSPAGKRAFRQAALRLCLVPAIFPETSRMLFDDRQPQESRRGTPRTLETPRSGPHRVARAGAGRGAAARDRERPD